MEAVLRPFSDPFLACLLPGKEHQTVAAVRKDLSLGIPEDPSSLDPFGQRQGLPPEHQTTNPAPCAPLLGATGPSPSQEVIFGFSSSGVPTAALAAFRAISRKGTFSLFPPHSSLLCPEPQQLEQVLPSFLPSFSARHGAVEQLLRLGVDDTAPQDLVILHPCPWDPQCLLTPPFRDAARGDH